MALTIDILSMNSGEMAETIASLDEKPFRAKQLYEWLHRRGERSYAQMSNLPKTLREKLEAQYPIPRLSAVRVLTSQIDGTQKYLFALEDGNVIESVRMRYSYGDSVCISTQVGCRMGCKFCASTIGGRIRDLTAAEMLSEVTEIERLSGERMSHIVLMGSGEPLDNYDNVVRFLRLISAPEGENRSLRNITLSTCGLVPEIRRLADEGLPVTLALSLHASNQEEREKLLPIAKRYALPDVLGAVQTYFEKTGRRITFEYSMVAGVNTSDEDADALAELLRGMNCHVNLIPVNPVEGKDFHQPESRECERFRARLEKRGLPVTVRREMGRDIAGACGQLRRSFLQEKDGSLVHESILPD